MTDDNVIHVDFANKEQEVDFSTLLDIAWKEYQQEINIEKSKIEVHYMNWNYTEGDFDDKE